MACGAWLFKPQFALIAVAFLIATRSVAIILGFTTIGVLFFTLAASCLGIFWPLIWIEALGKFSDQNFISNAPQMVSIVGTFKALLIQLGLTDDSIAPSLLLLLSSILTAVAALYFVRIWNSKTDNSKLFKILLTLGPLTLLLSPQTLFYDLGICIVPFLFTLNFNNRKTYSYIILINLLVAPLVYFRESLVIPIFMLIPLAAILFLEYRSKKSYCESYTATNPQAQCQ